MKQQQKVQPRVKKKPVEAKTTQEANAIRRFAAAVAAFVVWIGLIGYKLFDLQAVQHENLLARAVAQRTHEQKLKPLRGSILDRNGRELAVTLAADSLELDPLEFENVEQYGFQLAKILGKNPKELILQINEGKANKRRSLPLGRELNAVTIEKIKSLNIQKGLIWRKDQKRFYPNKTLAAQVLGFTNRDDIGQAGIEATQDKNLRGSTAEIIEARDGAGHIYERTENIKQEPREVILTIDCAIQHAVEEALTSGVRANKAKSGAAVVLDPKTGEILAMANYPTFDPNEPGASKPESWTNRAVQSFYEPGSTFKLVTYSATLEEGLGTPDDTINAGNGQIKIGSRTIKDSGSGGVMTLTQALAKSSNVAAITLGGKLGKNRLYEYIRRFGYGAQTGVELPAETKGLMYAPEKWTLDSMGSVPIGYEIGVTTLQSAAAFGAIANNGVRMQPHVVKELREGNTLVPQPKTDWRRVVSEETARKMRKMLEAVTEAGTARRAQLAGYTSAGKTGTAHKYDARTRGYSESKFVASFVGFAPIENPAVVIAVMIDEPMAGMHHGGDVAAPIFADIADQILPALHVAPDLLDLSPQERKQNLLTARNESPQPQLIQRTVEIKLNKEKTENKLPTNAKKTDLKSNPPRDKRDKIVGRKKRLDSKTKPETAKRG
jgi:cell division protein FtsI (penicillin-binding protein 3)